jgi:hypothetical protein
MSNQFGSTNNAAVIAAYPCPQCGAAVGVPCTVVDGRGIEMIPSAGAIHGVRQPAGGG